MPRIDAFVAAVMNPKAVEQHWRSGRLCRRVEFIQGDGPRAVQRDSIERPAVRMRGGSIDAVPAVQVVFASRAFGSEGPRPGSFGIVPRGGSESIDLR